jgi:hypothetical protein
MHRSVGVVLHRQEYGLLHWTCGMHLLKLAHSGYTLIYADDKWTSKVVLPLVVDLTALIADVVLWMV